MNDLSQLETYTNNLVSASKALGEYCGGVNPPLQASSTAHPTVRRARRNILAVAAQLQTLLADPADFIQHLAGQVLILPLSS